MSGAWLGSEQVHDGLRRRDVSTFWLRSAPVRYRDMFLFSPHHQPRAQACSVCTVSHRLQAAHVGSEAKLRYGSNHGTVWSLHLEELDNEGRPSRDDLRRQVAERTVLNAHDGQFTAQCQLEWQAVQVGVVIEVQLLQVLECSDLLREVLQQVLPQTQVRQVGEVPNAPG